MVLVKNGLNSEQITLIRPICIENFCAETSGLSEGGLIFEWIIAEFYCTVMP